MLLAVLCVWAETQGADPAPPRPLEKVSFLDDKQHAHEALGCVLIEAEDGGILFLEQDARLRSIEKPQIKARSATGEDFAPLSADAAALKLKEELGSAFAIHKTKHYVIAYDTSKPYAQWCGGMFERLYSAFHSYWKQRDFELHEPEFPLIAVVLRDEKSFAEFATRDVGPENATAKGYFNVGSNRMVLYDLSGTGGKVRDEEEVARKLQAGPFNVATLVHEATHQIAFNSGMHTRYADNPVWLTEGMAMYFETPDLSRTAGWKTVGALNPLRSRQFKAYLKKRPADSLTSLLESDTRLTAPETYAEAYAEAWALTYFLARTRKVEYTAYLKKIAAKPRLVWDKPAERVADFRAAFGDDLSKLDAEFVKYMRRVGPP